MDMTVAASASVRPGPGPRRRGWGRLALWLSLWSERRTLRTLDERMLADLGLSPAQARREARRPAWDVPPARRASTR